MCQYENWHISTRSGSNLNESLVLDAVVHETTNRTVFVVHHISQGSHKSSDIVHIVIISTTTTKGDSGSVVIDRNVLDSGRTSDCELHNKKCNKGKVKCFEWDASPPLSLSVMVVTCLAVRVSIPTVTFPIDQKIFDDLNNIRGNLNALCFAVIIAHFKVRVHLFNKRKESFKCFHGASGVEVVHGCGLNCA